MNDPSRIRVLIADGHPAVREGLSALLGRQPDLIIVGAATNGRETIDLYRSELPDVLLLDIGMLAIGGITTLRRIRSEFPQARIIATTVIEEEYCFRALQAGARACLLKDAPRAVWYSTVRSVAVRNSEQE